MKKSILAISIMGFIGMAIFALFFLPTFGKDSPKESIEALTDYDLYVTILDPTIDCGAKYCNLYIIVQECSSSTCTSCTSSPIAQVQYDKTISYYHLRYSTSMPYIKVSLVDNPLGSCTAGFNSNTCCVAVGQNCSLYVCP